MARKRNGNGLGRRIAYVLRHHPESVGIELDYDGGWANADELCAALGITRTQLEHVVATDDKGRYAFDDTGERIRAVQGHSIGVEMSFVAVEPPESLWHGTATRFLSKIMDEGLLPQGRQYVHLSPDAETAEKVGSRHGKPVVLEVDAAGMRADGHEFYRAQNGVWLTRHVLPRFFRVCE